MKRLIGRFICRPFMNVGSASVSIPGTADLHHPSSDHGMGISAGCFIFDFASLPLEEAQPI